MAELRHPTADKRLERRICQLHVASLPSTRAGWPGSRQPVAVPAGPPAGCPARRSRAPLAFRIYAVAQPKNRHHQAQDAALHAPLPSGRNILVAVDGSEDSKYALHWTVRELYRPGDVLRVAHCIAYLPLAAGLTAAPDARLALVSDVDGLLARGEEGFLTAAAQELQHWCSSAVEGREVSYVVDVLREEPLGPGDKGRIAQALCRKAEQLQAAALVVARQAHGGLSEFLLGSVAAHCTAHSLRPVLVLHAPPHPDGHTLSTLASTPSGGSSEPRNGPAVPATAARPEEGTALEGHAASPAGGSGSQGRSILLPVDDSEESERACAWAVQHLYRPGDTFHLLRVVPSLPCLAAYNGPAVDGLLLYSPPPTASFQSAARVLVEHRFQPRLEEAGVPYSVEIVVEETEESVAGVGDAICRKAEELEAAAVVLGSHMHGGLLQLVLGSVAARVARHCSRPVAILH